jgi:hypothetical protein
MRPLILICALLIAAPLVFASDASEDVSQQVLTPIHALFDGMRESDGDKVRNAFAPNAVIHRAHASLRKDLTPESFATAVENNQDQLWDEKIWDIKVNTDDKLASVWTQFAFIRNGELSHCGVNSFQLYEFEDGWKIIHLVDTFRQDGCVLPEQFR